MDRQCPWLPFIMMGVKWRQASGGRSRRSRAEVRGRRSDGREDERSSPRWQAKNGNRETGGRRPGTGQIVISTRKNTIGHNMNKNRARLLARSQTGAAVGCGWGASIRRPRSVLITVLLKRMSKAGWKPALRTSDQRRPGREVTDPIAPN